MPSLLEDLLTPACLPDETTKVTLVQTHVSLVFVADQYVYKVKKPVNFGFLDFSSLDKRRYYCHQEIKLNRRLSKGIYHGVLSVIEEGGRHRLVEGKDGAVEYAVKMTRIPDESLMKSIFNRQKLSEDHLLKVSEGLATFHSQALRNPEIDRFGRAEAFKVNTDENFQQVEKYIGLTVDGKDFEVLKGWTEDFYEKYGALFTRRITDGRIRDCHGDLHMEHICFFNGLNIIDCIEFNDRFRYSDTLADIAFLMMDLEFHGGGQSSDILWTVYRERAEEQDVEHLLTFYKVYRAFVRGKVNSFRLDDDAIDREEKEQAVETASRYFQLARSYIKG
jgi:aminoglycoside phosphotransferase family enzyme